MTAPISTTSATPAQSASPSQRTFTPGRCFARPAAHLAQDGSLPAQVKKLKRGKDHGDHLTTRHSDRYPGRSGIARKAYLPLLCTWPGIDLVGLYSRTQKTVDEVLAEWPIQFGTTSLEELLERQPQQLFVLTANASHFDLTRRC